jgi:hypothetical protein
LRRAPVFPILSIFRITSVSRRFSPRSSGAQGSRTGVFAFSALFIAAFFTPRSFSALFFFFSLFFRNAFRSVFAPFFSALTCVDRVKTPGKFRRPWTSGVPRSLDSAVATVYPLVITTARRTGRAFSLVFLSPLFEILNR